MCHIVLRTRSTDDDGGAGFTRGGAVSLSGARKPDRTLLIILASELASVGLTTTLASRHHLHVVAVASSLEQGRAALRKYAPEVILVGPEWVFPVCQYLDEFGLTSRIVVFGAQSHLGARADAVAAVACGYLSYLMRSNVYLPQVDIVSECPAPTLQPGQTPCVYCSLRDSLTPPKLNLTARELQIFIAIGTGFRPVDIAIDLGISVKTVEAHRERIKSKLKLATARELNEAAADWCRGGSS